MQVGKLFVLTLFIEVSIVQLFLHHQAGFQGFELAHNLIDFI